MKVRFLELALADLHRIEDYLRERSKAGADRVAGRIRKRIADLAQFPDQGTASRRRRGARQIYVTKTPYIVVYRVTSEEVQILAVIHAKQRKR